MYQGAFLARNARVPHLSVHAFALLCVFVALVGATTALEASGRYIDQNGKYLVPMESPLPDPDDDDDSDDAFQPPRPSTPPGWISSASGGSVGLGSVVVTVPSGYVDGEGAIVIGNTHVDFSHLVGNEKLIEGTELALLVIGPNLGHVLKKPIQVRFVLNAAGINLAEADEFVVAMYSPSDGRWISLPSNFDSGGFSLSASVSDLRPVPSDEPTLTMRTLVAVFASGISQHPLAADSAVPVVDIGPTVNRNANLRSGPGTTFSIVGQASTGQRVEPVSTSADGRWYKLDSGEWIASFLVDDAGIVRTERPVTQVPSPAPNGVPSVLPTVSRSANQRPDSGTIHFSVGRALTDE